jgi:hypothetical protein
MAPSKAPRLTRWWCDDCGTSGVIEHDQSAAVYEVIEALREGHSSANGGTHLDIARICVRGYVGRAPWAN